MPLPMKSGSLLPKMSKEIQLPMLLIPFRSSDMRNLNGVSVFPSRSIDNNAYQTARDDTTQGQLDVRLLAIQLSRSMAF